MEFTYVAVPPEASKVIEEAGDTLRSIDGLLYKCLAPNCPAKVRDRLLLHLEVKLFTIASNVKKLRESFYNEEDA